MSENLKVRAYTYKDPKSGRMVRLTRGLLPDDVPAPVVKHLRELGALGEPTIDVMERLADAADPLSVASGGAEGAVAPEPPAMPEFLGGTEGGGQPPEDPLEGAPDVASVSVADLAAFIAERDLNVGETVSLAGGDPALAGKVLEADKIASGGEGRKTVREPLEQLTASS